MYLPFDKDHMPKWLHRVVGIPRPKCPLNIGLIGGNYIDPDVTDRVLAIGHTENSSKHPEMKCVLYVYNQSGDDNGEKYYNRVGPSAVFFLNIAQLEATIAQLQAMHLKMLMHSTEITSIQGDEC